MSKRFTDAELAAEYWRAEADWAPMPQIGQWKHGYFAAHDRLRTLNRFATMPSYDEVTE